MRRQVRCTDGPLAYRCSNASPGLLHRRAPGPSMQQPGVAADFKAGHGPNLTVHLTAPLLTAQLHTAQLLCCSAHCCPVLWDCSNCHKEFRGIMVYLLTVYSSVQKYRVCAAFVCASQRMHAKVKWMISAQSPDKNAADRSPPAMNSLRLAIHGNSMQRGK